MSKGNIFLGFGRGKVGDVVFTRIAGEQVTRARNRSPKNPQTPIQLLQRVCMKTASLGYSMLQNICNHSFQGRQEGTECQSRFTTLNVAKLRANLQVIIDSGDPAEILAGTDSNYSKKSSTQAEFMPFIVSEGTMQSLESFFSGGAPRLRLGGSAYTKTDADLTYQDVVDALGLQQGDQLTFMWCTIDDLNNTSPSVSQFNGFKYARVILEPNDGDMSSLFLTNDQVNKPNPRNEGDMTVRFWPDTEAQTASISYSESSGTDQAGKVNSYAACCVIASRLAGGVWLRSSQSLVLRSYTVGESGALAIDHGTDYLGEAVDSYMTSQSSSLYLNQAEI
jgi:hypothetical protein